jgi:hypothetical protein
LHSVIDGFTAGPALLIGPCFDLLASNATADAVYGFETWQPGNRNVLWHLFMEPERRAFHDNWEMTVRTATALFRANYGRHLDDPRFADVISRLSDESSDFRAFWAKPAVLPFFQMEILLNHASVGPLRFQTQFLGVTELPDTHARFHVPVEGSGTREKLRSL